MKVLCLFTVKTIQICCLTCVALNAAFFQNVAQHLRNSLTGMECGTCKMRYVQHMTANESCPQSAFHFQTDNLPFVGATPQPVQLIEQSEIVSGVFGSRETRTSLNFALSHRLLFCSVLLNESLERAKRIMIIRIKDFDVLRHLQLVEEFKLLAQLDRKNTQTRQKQGRKWLNMEEIIRDFK